MDHGLSVEKMIPPSQTFPFLLEGGVLAESEAHTAHTLWDSRSIAVKKIAYPPEAIWRPHGILGTNVLSFLGSFPLLKQYLENRVKIHQQSKDIFLLVVRGSFQEFNLGPPTEKTVPRLQVRKRAEGKLRSGSVSEYGLAKATFQEPSGKSMLFHKKLLLFFLLICLFSHQDSWEVVSTPRNSGEGRAAMSCANHWSLLLSCWA